MTFVSDSALLAEKTSNSGREALPSGAGMESRWNEDAESRMTYKTRYEYYLFGKGIDGGPDMSICSSDPERIHTGSLRACRWPGHGLYWNRELCFREWNLISLARMM
jgi:hypothetical protein